MTTQAPYKPLAEGLKDVQPADRSEGPPEPPLKPFSGPPFEQKGTAFVCKVPGCSKDGKPFGGRHAIAVHLARKHGLTLDGKVHRTEPKAPATPPGPPPPPVSLRGLLQGTELSLFEQAVKVLERAKDNLSGKLSEMDTLKRKAARLDEIAKELRELL